jgi:L,D-peptidoglycan transpeptidase YkuD (ErfK/YbiS/YcfS/YnhG family)
LSQNQLQKLGHKLGVPSLYIAKTKQLIIVKADSKTGFHATCQLFEKDKNNSSLWVLKTGFPVVIGENGFAWGLGLHLEMTPKKMEGDGCSPAGVFELDISFGDSAVVAGSSWPYKTINQEDIFIDDVNSSHYNKFQQKTFNNKDWNSFEEMKRVDGLYNKGIVINHNMNPVKAGYGSAIFFHVWRSKDSATRGCTAMSYENIISLISWLDKAQSPLLIQLPKHISI